ncbi:hypothetical protein SAMN05444273_103473 [Litoreibacter ascidiaceicola]|uniref:Dihydroorotate dehydrogenase n=1 Tax=Litoreibacter ascidiaceicola TaxID=1486859 RepID=A0A1M4Y9Y3_9RHOB|nr:hypothetical protein [Litoreibacter ascidiaceicola]SHF02591.1 hypothetical protein SAMN05444273_103473 [Litoreibacter ascidiaceicola]
MTDRQNMNPDVDAELESFFAQARDEAPVPSSGLLARVSEDANATQAGFGRRDQILREASVPWWRQLFDDIGGLPAMGGLVASACTGIYLGFVNPDFATNWGAADTEAMVEAEGVMSHALLGDLYWIEEG